MILALLSSGNQRKYGPPQKGRKDFSSLPCTYGYSTDTTVKQLLEKILEQQEKQDSSIQAIIMEEFAQLTNTFAEVSISQDFVVKQLENNTAEVKSVRKALKRKEAIEDIATSTSSLLPPLPINDQHQLTNLEELLQDELVKMQLTGYLARLGGSSLTNLINTGMRGLMLKSVARCYSLLRKTGKKAFKELHVYGCLTGKYFNSKI